MVGSSIFYFPRRSQVRCWVRTRRCGQGYMPVATHRPLGPEAGSLLRRVSPAVVVAMTCGALLPIAARAKAGDTSTTVEVQQITLVSVPILLALAWTTAFVLSLVGRALHRPLVLYSGIIGLGLMALATPLVVHIAEALREGGSLSVSPVDFLLIGILSFLGGGITSVGVRRLGARTPAPSPAQGDGAVRCRPSGVTGIAALPSGNPSSSLMAGRLQSPRPSGRPGAWRGGRGPRTPGGR